MRKIVAGAVLALLLPGAALPAPDRYRSFLFGVDWYPEQWPESYWARDAQLMAEAGVNAVRMGEFAWYLMEPREGMYDFSLFDRAIATLGRHGIKTILGTPTAAPPKWLTEKYPEVLAAYADGREADDQTRRHTCYNSPVYRRLSRRIVEAMAEHFRTNPNVAGWQIDNEFNCHLSECYSDSCRQAFRDWLQYRYRDLQRMNERWGTGFWSQWYNQWGQVDLPFPSPAPHNPAQMLDFKRFISDSVWAFQHEQVDAIRRVRPNDFITHNGYFKNIDYFRLSRELDIFAFDNYPVFEQTPQYVTGSRLTTARGFMNRMMIMEQQTGAGGQDYLLRTPRPGEMSLWAMQAVAHGAEGVLHFRWRTARRGAEEYWSGVLETDNVPRARYWEFKKEGADLRRLGKEIFGAKTVSDIAVIKDFDAEWVFDYQYLTKEVNVAGEFHLFQAASEQKHNIDFISPRADFRRYRVVIAPHLILMDNDLAQAIRRFVEQGGTFVLAAHSAVKDRENAMSDKVKPILLTDLFGVEVENFYCYPPPSRRRNALRFADGQVLPVHVFADQLKVKPGTAVIATWDRDALKGTPAMTENRAGKGKAVYYASFFNLEAARQLIRRYAAEQRIAPLLTGVPKPVEVTRRTKNNVNYYFVLNHAATPVTVKQGAGYFDVLAGRQAPAALNLGAFEYRVLRK